MRQIKFRAWDKGWKQMVYPDVISHNINLGITIEKAFKSQDGLFYFPIQENLTIMQFTGLLDCEGKEVYEGDVLSNNFGTDKEVIRQVIFQNGSWIMRRIKGSSRLGEDILLGEYHLLNFKVIGNIYEHPNLLNNEI